jgi:MraZ protein
VDENPKPRTVQPPLGLYQARVDDKGRLKVPADIQRYLTEIFAVEGSEPRLFVTSLDLRIARLYTIPRWNETANSLQSEVEERAAAEDVLFLAKDVGGTSEIDSQSRVLMPAELRQMLKLESEPVWLDCERDSVAVLTRQVYEEKQRRSRENAEEKLSRLKQKGRI